MLIPQPKLAAANTPQRLTTADVFVREVLIEAHHANKKRMFISSTEALAGTTNRHSLKSDQSFVLNAQRYGGLDARINLKEIWINGESADDLLVVSYVDFSAEGFC